jgi:uncharacterized protein (DUF2267 family)
MPMPQDVTYASQFFQQWLADLKVRALLQTHNQSYAMLRAVLHEVRSHLDANGCAMFANALPPLVRGVFYEGWNPSQEIARSTSDAEVVRRVTERLAPHHVPPETIIVDVFSVMARLCEPAEEKALKAALPDVMRRIWPKSVTRPAKPLF